MSITPRPIRKETRIHMTDELRAKIDERSGLVVKNLFLTTREEQVAYDRGYKDALQWVINSSITTETIE